jgi:hypothetical protein
MSGGGGGNQSVTQEFKPPEMTKPGWQGYLDAATALRDRPYEQSGLPQVAPMNDYQDAANKLAYDLGTYGTPQGNAANGAFYNAASGTYANPWAQNLTGLAMGEGGNPALGGYEQMANSGPNPYTSDAYTQQMIKDSSENMANAYATGDAANMNAAAARSGAFGGSAHDQRAQAGAAGLAKQVGQNANQMLQQQQQYKGNMYNQDFSNRMGALGGFANTYNQDIANMMGANAQGGQMYQNDIGNILAGAQGGLAGNQDYRQNLSGLMQAGNNQNSYYQKLLDQYNNQWATQEGYDALQNDIFGTALSRASGSYGGQATTGPGQSPWANLGGLLAGGAGLYSLFKP